MCGLGMSTRNKCVVGGCQPGTSVLLGDVKQAEVCCGVCQPGISVLWGCQPGISVLWGMSAGHLCCISVFGDIT